MKIPLSKKAPESSIETRVQEYAILRDQKKSIEGRMKELASDIKTFAERNGSRDDKGSSYCDLDSFVIGCVAKKSVSFIKDAAISFFKMKNFTTAIDTVEVINEKAVEGLISSGKISYEDLEAITETKTSFSVDIREKTEMPTVEQTTLVAASKKPLKRGK